MTDPFVAEIRIFSFNFPPRGWAFCDGQLLPVTQNTALYSLLGYTYGGNGQTTFALPDLRGRAAMHAGQGQGLSSRPLGESAGDEVSTLVESELPAHSHTMTAAQGDANTRVPEDSMPATGIGIGQYAAPGTLTSLAPQATASGGGGQPHNNMQPYLTMNFCIALQGVFPQRP